jgi:hypothetical protein
MEQIGRGVTFDGRLDLMFNLYDLRGLEKSSAI